MRKKAVFWLVVIGMISLISCEHEPSVVFDCKVSDITYTNYIQYIIESKCLGCHTANSIQPTLDTYPQVMVVVNDGRLKNVITGANGYPSMPYQSEPLADCVINNIISWIDHGAPE